MCIHWKSSAMLCPSLERMLFRMAGDAFAHSIVHGCEDPVLDQHGMQAHPALLIDIPIGYRAIAVIFVFVHNCSVVSVGTHKARTRAGKKQGWVVYFIHPIAAMSAASSSMVSHWLKV